ncbi:hypothetical protein CHU95_12860 [Niveispirillum lacus]|uniref:Uncharacterized protein n=2 Tax=Niveispirillum lacus TaxID=1981099 RepID=A0A255YYK5_9PROT|nr:hypothetical protein CHU95_12860 [Niveispirillum lacus]
MGHDLFQECRKGQERLKAGSLFIRYLKGMGLVARPLPPTSPTQIWPLLGAFRTWMQDQRGVARSIASYCRP